jgi:hypothetical protein
MCQIEGVELWMWYHRVSADESLKVGPTIFCIQLEERARAKPRGCAEPSMLTFSYQATLWVRDTTADARETCIVRQGKGRHTIFAIISNIVLMEISIVNTTGVGTTCCRATTSATNFSISIV